MNRTTRATRRGRVRWSSVGLSITLGLLLVVFAHGQNDEAATQPVATQPADRTLSVTTQPDDGGYFPKVIPAVERPKLPDEVTKAFVIPIRSPVSSTMADAIKRKIARITSQGGELVIFDFNTPGGRVDAAQDIASTIRAALADVRTVAFVNTDAISAGAWLAISCHEIVMAPNASIGDCAPLMMGGTLEGIPREKIETYIRDKFELAAEDNGYWPALAVSMVSAHIEVWLIQNVKTGEQRYVRRADWIDSVRNPPGATTAPAGPESDWRLVRVVVHKGELLTAHTREAQRLGFVKAVAKDLDELKGLYNITADPVVLADTWSERIVDFLTSPAVTGLLIMMAMFFGYIELNTPGFGLGGTLALICLAVLFGSRFLTGLAQWWEIAVFVIGVILVMIEIFVTPGVGLLGLTGGVLCIVGLLAMLIANPPGKLPIPSPGLVMDQFLDALFAIAVGFLAGLAGCIIVGRYLPKIPIAGRLVLADVPTADSLPADAGSPIRRITEGQRGVTESFCRPSGKARFGEDLIDVVTDGRFLPAGTAVVVLRNEGNRLVVEPVEQNA